MFVIRNRGKRLEREITEVVRERNLATIILGRRSGRNGAVVRGLRVRNSTTKTMYLFATSSRKETRTRRSRGPETERGIMFRTKCFVNQLNERGITVLISGNVRVPSSLRNIICAKASD